MPSLSSVHLMYVRSWLLNFGCALVVASVFYVLLCRELTTTESRAKILARVKCI